MLVAGLEPARYRYRGILSPLRLPFRHTSKILEVPPRLELGIRVLQTLALPLGEGTKVSKRKIWKPKISSYGKNIGAEDEIRTRDICLGKATLYHWATPA